MMTNRSFEVYQGHMSISSVDEHDQPVSRTKSSHPYSYDGFVTWRSGANNEAESTIYSDRLLEFDRQKHNDLCRKHFGDEKQYWDDRSPLKIEAFLRDWTDNQKLRLILIMEYCNQSSGYPCWRFDYATK